MQCNKLFVMNDLNFFLISIIIKRLEGGQLSTPHKFQGGQFSMRPFFQEANFPGFIFHILFTSQQLTLYFTSEYHLQGTMFVSFSFLHFCPKKQKTQSADTEPVHGH